MQRECLQVLFVATVFQQPCMPGHHSPQFTDEKLFIFEQYYLAVILHHSIQSFLHSQSATGGFARDKEKEFEPPQVSQGKEKKSLGVKRHGHSFHVHQK